MLDELTLRTLTMRDLLFSTEHPRLNIGPGMANLEATLPDTDIKIALDRNLKALAWLRGTDNLHLVNALAEYLPFRDNSLPTITTQSTFQVMDDQKQFLDELARTLTLGGFFCITIEWRVWYQPEKQSFTVYDLSPLQRYMESQHLKITEIKYLDNDGKWHDTPDKEFSLWIMGIYNLI